jgi:dCTP deaminase
MYLSDRDLWLALESGQLIVDPRPAEVDTTSIDLHLDRIEEAKIWNVELFAKQQAATGAPAILGVGEFRHKAFADRFAVMVPSKDQAGDDPKVYRDGMRVILRPGGFFLWQTKETVGTPELDPRLICFVDGKSTRARTGLIVHMTAPTIHAGWWGQITLEIANLGPFTLALQPGDAIAQIVVAAISSPPLKKKGVQGIAVGQRNVAGGG